MATEMKIEQDTLVWKIYIPGKSDMSNRKYQEEIAANWGIKLEFFFGDCTGTYDEKIQEFEKENQAVFAYLENKYGNNWREKFDQEVELLKNNEQ